MKEIQRLLRPLASLRITVVLLALTVVLVFIATIDQVEIGLHGAQTKWFQSFFGFWKYPERFWFGETLKGFPVWLPAGYVLGPLLLLNLLAAFIVRFRFTLGKLGIHLIHIGVMTLIVSQFVTDLVQVEDQMMIFEGEKSDYLKSFTERELAIIDRSHPETDSVVVIPWDMISDASETVPVKVEHDELPFQVVVRQAFANVDPRGREGVQATKGISAEGWRAKEMPEKAGMDDLNFETALVELKTKDGTSIGSWLASLWFSENFYEPQRFEHNGKSYEIALRRERTYLPYSITANKVIHEQFAGTEMPRNFQSDVRIDNKETGESLDAKIFMNNPLRYGGKAFFQYQMNASQMQGMKSYTVFQVVTNPGWTIPYIASLVVGFGLFVQFVVGLVRYSDRYRKKNFVRTSNVTPPVRRKLPGLRWWDAVLMIVAGVCLLAGVLLGYEKVLIGVFGIIAAYYLVRVAWLLSLLRSTESVGGASWIAGGSALLLTLLMTVGWIARNAKGPESDLDIGAFGKLPVSEEGRVKPLDTVARNYLFRGANKQRVINPEGDKVPAIYWLTDVLFDPVRADKYKAFYVVNLDVLALLDRKFDNQNKYLSFSDFVPGEDSELNQNHYLAKLQDQSEKASGRQSAERSPFDNAVLRLHGALSRYRALKHTIQHPGAGLMADDLIDLTDQTFPKAARLLKTGSSNPDDSRQLSAAAQLSLVYWQMNSSPLLLVPPVKSDGEPTGDWHKVGEAYESIPVVAAVKEDGIFTEATRVLEAAQSGNLKQASDSLGRVSMELARRAENPGSIGDVPFQPDPVLKAYIDLGEAYRNKQAESFNAGVATLKTLLSERGDHKKWRPPYEFAFNRISFEVCTLVFYGVAFLLACVSLVAGRKPLYHAALLVLAAGFCMHTFGLVSRMLIQGRPPVTNLYSSAVFIGWAAVGSGVLLEILFRRRFGIFAATAVGGMSLLILHQLAVMEAGDTMSPPRAVLDSNFWLTIHVITVTLGYAATALAGVLGIGYVLAGMFSKRIKAPDAKILSGIVFGILCFALFFSFVGTVTGGIWADQSWGRFWGWDPKENGALMIVLWNALVLHARVGRLVKNPGFMSLCMVGIIITLWSWFGTNMLGVGLHAYGFVEGAFAKLFLAAALCALFAVFTVVFPRRAWQSPDAAGL